MTRRTRDGAGPSLRADPFLAAAALFLTAGLLAVGLRLAADAGLVAGLPGLRWTMVHLVTVGGLAQAAFGALPSLGSGARGGTRRLGAWLSLNAGFVAALAGMVGGRPTVAAAGPALVLLALVLVVAPDSRSGRAGGTGGVGGSGADRPAETAVDAAGTTDGPVANADDPAANADGPAANADGPAATPLDSTARTLARAAPWFLAAGMVLAAGMLLGYYGPGGYVGGREAHIHANAWGFLGLLAAAVLLRAAAATGAVRPRRRVVAGGLVGGAVLLVAGPWLDAPLVTVAGLGGYLAGTLAVLGAAVAAASAGGWLADPRTGHVLGAYLWLLAPVPVAPAVLLAPGLVPAGAVELAAVTGLVYGWLLQLAFGLLPVAARALPRAGQSGRRGGAATPLPAAVGAALSGDGRSDDDRSGADDDRSAADDEPSAGDDRSAAGGRSPAAAGPLARASWAGVAAANAGVALLWAAPFAAGPRAAALRAAGFALVALPWAAFLPRLYRAVAGGRPEEAPHRTAPAADGGRRD